MNKVLLALASIAAMGIQFSALSQDALSQEAPVPAAGAAGASPRIAEWRHSGASLLARRPGKLAIAGGCLVLTGADGSTTLPVFPAGSASWSANGTRVVFKGTSYAVGDAIELSGGAFSAEAAGRGGLSGLADCPADAMFLVN